METAAITNSYTGIQNNAAKISPREIQESEEEEEEEETAPFAIHANVKRTSESEMTRLTPPKKTAKFADDSSEIIPPGNDVNDGLGPLLQSTVLDDSIVVSAVASSSLSPTSPLNNANDKSLDFSQLMQEADDTISEESASSHHMHLSTNTSTTHPASNLHPHKIMPTTTTRLGEDTFKVETYISHTTVRSAIFSSSNPDLLRVWCAPILAAYVTTETSSRGVDDPQREYDGEWIEAAATLRSPPTSTFNQMCNTMKTYLGFPTHGRLTLFIERNLGQISLSIGPLGGAVEVIHKMTFVQSGHGVEVTDNVRIHREATGVIRKCLCFCKEKWCMANLDSHMQQALESMQDLRILVEHGETAVVAVSRRGAGSLGEGVTPLLGGPII